MPESQQEPDVRPLDRDDYERLYAVLHALRSKAYADEDRPVWEILRDIHEEYLSPHHPVPLDDLVGDQAASREISHAMIVVERLMRGLTTISRRPTNGVAGVCATTGCPNLTFATYCWHCELAQ
ncbi:hypothetical protein ACVCAH_11495 [Micromonospora sp. LZ34]